MDKRTDNDESAERQCASRLTTAKKRVLLAVVVFMVAAAVLVTWLFTEGIHLL